MIKIKLNKQEACRFFGNMSRIAEVLSIYPSAVSKWPEDVPEASAWALQYASNLPKYRSRKRKIGALKFEVVVD